MPPGADAARLRTRDAIALGLLHGPAELLPVSSSAHTTLVPWLLGWPYASLDADVRKSFEVALHAGAIAAVLVGTRDELAAEIRSLRGPGLRRLALAALPPAITGLGLEGAIARRLAAPGAIAAGVGVGGVAMGAADAAGPRTRRHDDATDLDALLLGLAQACALWPGVSRHGAALTAARARGFDRADADALSRHISLPVIVGATALKAWYLVRDGPPPGTARAFAAGVAASFVSGLASTRLARAECNRSLVPFAAYRLALAAVVLARVHRGGARVKSHEIHPASDVRPPPAAAQ
jgi:undecaprenyl-diphosphatase